MIITLETMLRKPKPALLASKTAALNSYFEIDSTHAKSFFCIIYYYTN